jgi:hypothetical protein
MAMEFFSVSLISRSRYEYPSPCSIGIFDDVHAAFVHQDVGAGGNWWKRISACCSGFDRPSRITRPAIYLTATPGKAKVPLGKEKVKSPDTTFHQFIFPLRW